MVVTLLIVLFFGDGICVVAIVVVDVGVGVGVGVGIGLMDLLRCVLVIDPPLGVVVRC